MVDNTKNAPGFLAFAFVFLVFFVSLLTFQKWLMHTFITSLFPNYVLVSDVLPVEWIIMNREPGTDEASEQRRVAVLSIFENAKRNEYDAADKGINTLLAKRALKNYSLEQAQTLYFVNPYIAFSPLFFFVSALMAFLVSLFLPGKSPFSWMRSQLIRSCQQIQVSVRKQFESHALAFDPLLLLTPQEREDSIRGSTLPEIVISEMDDFVDVHRWTNGHSVNPIIPLKFYFRYRISTKYSNLIQGFVAGGAAVLIFIIGLRGLKLIPAEEPSLILMALSLEFMLLIVLMFSFAGSAQEERLDRVMKELEAEQRDAIKQQTATLHQVIEHSGLGQNGISADDSIAEHEERRILDEVLALMLREAEKRRTRRGR